MKLDIDSRNYNFKQLEKIMKDKARKKRNQETLDLIDLRKQEQKIKEQIDKVRKECTHPRRYLKVKCTSYYGNDGYGGSEYCNGRYSLVCDLCGEWDVVEVKDRSDV